MTQIRKYSLALIIVAAFIIELIGGIQYFMAQSGAKNEILAKAQRDMAESQRVAMVKTEVETALRNAEQSVRVAIDNPETSYCIASRIITVNPHIIGVGVAFIPNYYKNKGKNGLFLPYTYDDQPSIVDKGKRIGKPHIMTRIPNFDYTKREWYKSAMAGNKQWTEAYLGEGGLNVLMCTYSIPVEDKSGRLACVLFADVTMEDATVLMNNMDSDIRKNGLVVFVVQLLSMLLMGFIVWRAVSASRRYKEQVVDSEKAHLIEQLEKMREVNTRLTKRNQELAGKLAELRNRYSAESQTTDTIWYR